MPMSPLPGTAACTRHRKSWASSSAVGSLNDVTGVPWGLNAPAMTLMVPSLPAASMPWRTISTACLASAQIRAWSSVSRVRLAARMSSASSFWRPKVAPQSNDARSTFSPGLTRSISRSVRWVSFLVIASSCHRRVMRFAPHRNAGASDPLRDGVGWTGMEVRRARWPASPGLSPGQPCSISNLGGGRTAERQLPAAAVGLPTHGLVEGSSPPVGLEHPQHQSLRPSAPPMLHGSLQQASTQPLPPRLRKHVYRVYLGSGVRYILVPRRTAAHEAGDPSAALGDPCRSAAVNITAEQLPPRRLARINA